MANGTDTLKRLNAAWIEAKKARKLTQGKAAQALGVTQSFYSEMLNGKKPLSLEWIFKLSLFLEKSPMEIAPDIVEPYAEAFYAMIEDVKQSAYEKDQIIADLERRLSGSEYSVAEPQATHNNTKHDIVSSLLSQLPVYETDLLIQSLQSRVNLLQGESSMLTTAGKAAVDLSVSDSARSAKSKVT